MMTSPEDLAQDFQSALERRKNETFEDSTLSLLLRQLGASASRVRSWQTDLGPDFGFDWFNRWGLIAPNVYTDRCFSFNFQDLFRRPTKHPITKMFLARLEESDVDAVCLIFKVADWGRMVATNMKLPGLTHIHVLAQRVRDRDIFFNVVPFPGFFQDKYGHLTKDHINE
jgi:hypothetical protein